MTVPLDRIENAEAVTSAFGYWPSFHDAEVLEVSIKRAGELGANPCLTAVIHVFEMTSQVSPDGHYVCQNHSVVTLLFQDLDNLALDGFNHQNALSSLSIEAPESDASVIVRFEGAYGLECELTCQSVKVMSFVPGIPPASVYASRKA